MKKNNDGFYEAQNTGNCIYRTFLLFLECYTNMILKESSNLSNEVIFLLRLVIINEIFKKYKNEIYINNKFTSYIHYIYQIFEFNILPHVYYSNNEHIDKIITNIRENYNILINNINNSYLISDPKQLDMIHLIEV